MTKTFKHIITGIRNAANRWAYRRAATQSPIDAQAVLFDQQHGMSLDGNLHYIARELADTNRYGALTLYFAVSKRHARRFERLLAERGVPAKPVVRSTRRYYRLLATSRYLVTDTSFPLAFVKRDDQVMWNTWHGTPLKTLGRAEVCEAHLIGNIQKNFAQADFLSFPNEYSARHIIDDYMLAGLANAQVLLAEYPRNEPFARTASREARSRFIPEGTRAYAYLPTFRFSPDDGSKAAAIDEIARYLGQIDRALGDDEIMFAKLHPAIGKAVALDGFARIRAVPDSIELYEFLNLCDALVTDYSSVMFDFEITGKKIVLFTFDRNRYQAERGLYRDLDALPFPQVADVEGLIRELHRPDCDHTRDIVREMNPYGAEHTTEKLCRRVFEGEAGLVEERELADSHGTRSLVLIDQLPADEELGDFNRRMLEIAGAGRVCIAFPCSIAQHRVDFLAALSPRIEFIPFSGRMALSPRELCAVAACKAGIMSERTRSRMLSDALDFEARRIFGNASFKQVICLADNWKLVELANRVSVIDES